MNYQELTVDFVGKSSDGEGYNVKVGSSLGYNAEEEIIIPENAFDSVAEIDGLVRGNTRKAEIDDDIIVVEPDVYGERLFEALFTGDLRRVYDKASSAATQGSDNGLRIKLQFNLGDDEEARLAEIPWELMRDSAEMQYLSLNRRTPIVRYVNAQQRINLEPLEGPLRVLVVMASPKGEQMLDLAREEELIRKSWAADPDVEVTFLPNATKPRLQESIPGYHVLHYMGHGVHSESSGGAIVLEDADGNADFLDADRLGQWVRGESLRLVVLNACETAKSDDSKPFASVAPRLVMAGVPAVIAMQFPISDEAAIDFSTMFYSRLVAGAPVDEATARGRGAISAGKGGDLEWGTPILFMRAPDGQLFSHTATTQNPAVVTTPGATPVVDAPAAVAKSNRGVIASAAKIVGGIALAVAGFLLWQQFQEPKDFRFAENSYDSVVGRPVTVRFESVDPDKASDAIRYRDVQITSKSDELEVGQTEKVSNGWQAVVMPLAEGSFHVRARAVPFSQLNGKTDPEKESVKNQYSWQQAGLKVGVDPAVSQLYESAQASLKDPDISSQNLLTALATLRDHALVTPQIYQWTTNQIGQLEEVASLRSAADARNGESLVTLEAKLNGYDSWRQRFAQVRGVTPGPQQLANLKALQAVPQLGSLAFCKSDTYCSGDVRFGSERVHIAVEFPAELRGQTIDMRFYQGARIVKEAQISLGQGSRAKRWNNVYASGEVVGRAFDSSGRLLAERVIQLP